MAVFHGRQTPARTYGLRKGVIILLMLGVGTVILGWLQFGWWGSEKPQVVQARPERPLEPTPAKVSQAFPSAYEASLPAIPAVAHANGQVPKVQQDESWKIQQQAKLDALMQAVAELKRQQDSLKAQPDAKADTSAQNARKAAEAAAKAAMEARKQPHIHVAPVSKTAQVGVQPQAHPLSLSAGWLLPVIFEDRLSNQTAGIAKFVVREPVQDSATGRYTLIPQGSHGLVRVTTGQLFGTERLSVQVLSLTWPNGDHLALPKAHAGDQTGQSGLQDQVDRRWGQLFASVLLTGVLRGGSSMIISSSTGGASTMVDAMAAESAREGQKSVQQFIDTTPKLTIRQGYLASIRLEESLVVGKAYGE